MYKRYFKRIIDLSLSLLALLFLSPLLIILIIMIKIDSVGPIMFKQERVGKDNIPFVILKFRTMMIDTPKDCPTHLLSNPDKYITKIGHYLRKSSLDELPQLINIICGEMSIVGPRPSLFNQVDLNKLRDINGSSRISPGLTGLAQISGRDELDITVKAELDGKYSNEITFFYDFKIIMRTFLRVVNRDGVKEGINNK